MECSYIFKLLCAYLDGELDSKRSEIVEKHLKQCEPCRRELKLQKLMKSLIYSRFSNIGAPDSLRRRIMLELERADEYRESGIDALDLIRWGTHVAQFYKTRNELTEVVVPFLTKGLEQNELCVWITSDISTNEAREAMEAEALTIQEYVDRGQLQIVSHEDWYLLGGSFNCQCTLSNGFQKCQEALSNGYSGLRVIGDVFWLKQPDWSSFMEYEERVNSVVHEYKILIICAYKESGCTKNNIVDVMNTHRYVITKIDDSWRVRRATEAMQL